MKVLVLGYGSIGRRHTQVLAATTSVGIVDSSVEARERAVADRITDVFDTVARGSDWGPDAVVIATPTNVHTDSYKKVLELDCPVLVEKPIANTSDDLDFFASIGMEAADRTAVVANMRFHAGIAVLRDNLERLGRPLAATAHFGSYLPAMRPGRDYRTVYAAHRAQGGGVLLDCIHELDYLWWMFGTPTVAGGHLARLSQLEMDAEDHAVTVLDHESGVRSIIEMDFLQMHKLRGCRITGDEGTLIWQSRAKAPEIVHVAFFGPEQRQPVVLLDDHNYDMNVAFSRYIEEFLLFVRTGNRGELLDLATAIQEARLLLSIIARSNLN